MAVKGIQALTSTRSPVRLIRNAVGSASVPHAWPARQFSTRTKRSMHSVPISLASDPYSGEPRMLVCGTGEISKIHDVLMLCPQARDRRACESTSPPPGEAWRFHFLESELQAVSRDEARKFDMVQYINEAAEYVEQRGISAVISAADVADLCHAALHERLPSVVRGPTVESVYSCADKLRTRSVLAGSDDLPYCKIDIYDVPQLSDLPVPTPCFIKPNVGVFSQLAFRVDTQADLENACAAMRNDLSNITHFLPEFLEEYDKSGNVDNPCCSAILEAFVPDEWAKVTVDGFIADGKAVVLGTAENIYYASRPVAFHNGTYPTPLTVHRQDAVTKMEQRFTEHCNSLIKLGFDNQVLNIEFFLGPNDKIYLMEVNARASATYAPLYRGTSTDGIDQYTLSVELGLGRQASLPKSNGLVGSVFYVNVLPKQGQRAYDILDFDAASEIPSFDFKVKPDEVLGEVDGGNGKRLGVFYVFSESYAENLRQGTEMRRRIIKEHSQAFWD